MQLNEKYTCDAKYNAIKSQKYDNDNFIFQIYVEEIINYLSKLKIKESNYNNKLFQFSQMTYLLDVRKCSNCGKNMRKQICCKNYPNYLIINCVWINQQQMNLNKIIKFYILLSLKDDLSRLFEKHIKKNKKSNCNYNYNLSHIILYSHSLAHYITAVYNPTQKVFCLYDDSSIIEFNTLMELIEKSLLNY